MSLRDKRQSESNPMFLVVLAEPRALLHDHIACGFASPKLSNLQRGRTLISAIDDTLRPPYKS